MTLFPENNQNNLDSARRNIAISSAAAMFVVGWFFSGILYFNFKDSKLIPYWLLVSITIFIPSCLAIRSWKTEMKKPPPVDPKTVLIQSVRVFLKRLYAGLCAFGAFFLSWLLVYGLLGQAMNGVTGGYAVLSSILTMILPLGIGIMVFKNVMNPLKTPTQGFEVIMHNPNTSSEKPTDNRK